MAVIETWLEQDLQSPVKVRYIDGSLFSNNGNGNRIGVRVYDNGEPVELSGTVSGYVIVADGSTVPCTGSRSGNQASILIPPAAYQPGAVLISVFLTDGNTVTTLAAIATTVMQTRTNSQVSPGSVVEDWTQTINAAMQAVVDASAVQDAKISGLKTAVLEKEQNISGELFGTDEIFTVIPGMLNGSMKWTTGLNAAHISIPIDAGDTIKITANNSAKAQYAFLKSDFVEDGQTSDYVENTTRYDITKGTSSTFTAPSGAEYLFILTYYNNIDYFPAEIVINGVDRLQSISDKIKKMFILDKNDVDNEIASNTDINTITVPGNYTVKNSTTAQSLLNYPTTVGGRLLVMTVDNSGRVIQFVIADNNKVFVRYYGSGAWTTWNEFAYIDGFQKALLLNKSDIPNVIDDTVSETYLDTILTPGNYIIKNSTAAQHLTTWPSSVGGRLTVFDTDNSGRVFQIAFDADTRCLIRYHASNTWTSWVFFASEYLLNGSVKLSHSGVDSITSGSDLNDYTAPGNYLISSTSVAQSLANGPSMYGGRLMVLTSSYSIQQIYVSDMNTIFCRKRNTSNEWSEWGEISYRNENGLGGKVVDLFIFMGQSNMSGRGVTNATWPETAPTVPAGVGYEFRAISDPTKLYPIVEPFGVNENNDQGIHETNKTGDMVASFAIQYYALTGIPIVGVSASQGSTTSAMWLPTDTLLPDAIQRFEDAVTYLTANGFTIRHKFMCWCQGESDSTRGTSAETYVSNMQAILDAMFNVGVEKCFLYRIGKYVGLDQETNPMRIYNAQTEMAATDSRLMMAITSLCTYLDRGLLKDDYHYYQAGYNEMGRISAINIASFVNSQIEPVMYDPLNDDLYYPKKIQ